MKTSTNNTVSSTDFCDDEASMLWKNISEEGDPQKKQKLLLCFTLINSERKKSKEELETLWDRNRIYMKGMRGWVLRNIFRVKLSTGPTSLLVIDESWRLLGGKGATNDDIDKEINA